MRKVCIGLALALAFAMWGATASAVNIYFAAPDDTTAPVTATVGQIVPVAVFVQDVVGMSGYAVKIDVSGPGAAVSHAVDGTWLKTGHAVWADHANDPSDLSWAILLSPLSISGSGDLTIFYVQVTGVGDIDVAFNASPFDTFLSDINGDPVPDLGLGQPYRITGEGATNLVLSVQSLPMQGVDIAGDKPGTTNYQASCTAGDDVSLTAPDPIADGDIDYSLVGWTLNGVPASPGATLALTNISEHTTVVAMYARQTRTLNVASNPELNASIIGVGDLADRSGTTPYTATCGDEEAVSLAAPAVIISGTDHEFSHWTVDSVDQPAGQRTIDLTMSTATSAVANYVVYNELVVQSAPISGVSITSEAAGDVDVSGTTNYDLKWLAPAAPRVVFTAPETAASGALDYVFVNWTKDGADQGAGVRTLDFSMNGDFTCVAGYAVVQRNLAVSANVAVTITATPEAAGGDTDYARTLADETAVTLNAPVSVTVDTTEYLFVKWSLDTVDQPEGQTALSLTMSDDHAAAATYAAAVTLNVASSLDAEASVSITGTKPGDTPYSATCYTGQTVTLTAPASVAVGASSYMFEKWVVGAAEYTTREVSVAVTEATTATATYTEAQNSTYAFSYTHPGSVTMGADVVVPVTFENNDPPGSLGYDAVRFSFSATGPGTTTFKATDTLGTEYTFTNSGVWGPPAGFPLPAVYSGTDDWTLNFSAAGEYTITFNCFEIGNEASPFATDSVVVTVDKATPIVSEWPTASAIVTGEALSQSTLTGGAATVDGSFAFVDPAAVPPEGTCVADAIFTPTDTANYNTVPGTVSVLVRGTLALTIDSVPQGIGITGDVPGTTPYTEDVVDGSAVDLMAPAYAIVGGTTQKFVNWNVDGGADLLDRALTVTMDAAHSAVATYEVAPVTVYVASAAGSVDPIAATEGNIVQIAAFVANVNQMAGFDVKLSITGPGTAIGLATLGNWYDAQTSSTFDMPLADELMSMILTPRDISGSGDIAVYSILVTGAGTITVGLDPDISYLGDTAAGYIDFVPGAPIVINATEEALPVLTVESFPAGVGIGGSNSKGGNANYSVTCDEDEQVTLTADPAVVVVGAHYNFVRWIVDGTPQADLQTDVIVTMDGNRIVKALYEIVTWTLTVQSTPPGIDIMGSRPGQTDYTATCDDAEVVNLTATSLALLGGQTYGFVRWTGYADGQTAISVTMTADTTVIAEYVAVSHDLTVTSTPILGVDITGDKPGTTEYGAACNVNVSVLLIAPDSFAVGDLDYAFVRWTGHTDGDQSIAVLMDADKTAAAEYALAKRTLTVASDPSGVAIDGAGEYDDQTVVTLDAPDTAEIGGKDYRFSGWTVDGNAVAGDPINVTMDADHAAVASYTIQRWTLTVASDPSGVSIDGAGEYDDQTVVELAAPAPTTTIGGKTYNFTGWTVDGAPVSGNPINVTMDADHSAVANYQVAEYTLAVNSEPIKAVAIASDQAPGNTDYTTSVSAGSTVELTAPSQVTDGGKRYNFTGWTGDYTGANPATVVMDAQKSVTANYAVQTWTLTANSAPPGIVDEVQVVEDNTTVTLTAPDQGVVGGQRFNFVNWSTGAGTLSIDVTVTEDTTITANYEVQTCTLAVASDPAGVAISGAGVYEDQTVVTLDAPATAEIGGQDYNFVKWTVDGSDVAGNPIDVTMDDDHDAVACYTIQTWTLAVDSSPFDGVAITGDLPGTTVYTETVDDETVVNLSAPAALNVGGVDYKMVAWMIDGVAGPAGQVDVQVTVSADTELEAAYAPAATLVLDAQDVFVKTGESFAINLTVQDLMQLVNGCQAIVGFNPSMLSFASADDGVAPWDMLIWSAANNTAGTLDLAVGVDALGSVGVDSDAIVAVLTFTAGSTDGTTTLWFRENVSEVEMTMLADMNAQAVLPLKIGSQVITIDGTAPFNVQIVADPASWTDANTVTLTFSAEDALSGIAKYELKIDDGAFEIATSPTDLDVSLMADGTYTVTVKATDNAGNSAEASTTIYLDKTDPVVSIDAITQGGTGVMLPGGAVALQGLVEITVSASDATAGLAGNPAVDQTPDAGEITFASGTYVYTCTIDASTTNGLHTVTATATDNVGNTSTATATYTVNRNRVAGAIELDSLAPTASGFTRMVTFVATDAAGGDLKTWSIDVPFEIGMAVSSYTLTDVPDGTVRVSAKTNWNLRRRLDAALDTDGQAVADFVGDAMLLGGDLNNSNTINILDWSMLKINWFETNAVSDINGDGVVAMSDYLIMQTNWFKVGDAQ